MSFTLYMTKSTSRSMHACPHGCSRGLLEGASHTSKHAAMSGADKHVGQGSKRICSKRLATQDSPTS